MKNPLSVFGIVVVLCFVSNAHAQRPGGGRGVGGPPGGGPPQRGLNQENFNNTLEQTPFGNQATVNQNSEQDIPTIQQLAQMMIANFDADGSGELGQAELQSALAALRQMMQNRTTAQNQTNLQQSGITNQQNAFQSLQNLPSNQVLGNRPSPFSRGNARRVR